MDMKQTVRDFIEFEGLGNLLAEIAKECQRLSKESNTHRGEIEWKMLEKAVENLSNDAKWIGR